MKFVSFAEQVGLEKGRKEAIALGLRLKFGPAGSALMPQVEKVKELDALQAICEAIEPAVSLDDVRKLIPALGPTE